MQLLPIKLFIVSSASEVVLLAYPAQRASLPFTLPCALNLDPSFLVQRATTNSLMVIITGCENAAVRPGKEGRGASSSLSSTSAQAYHAAALGECQHGEAQSAHSLSAAALPLALADQSILDARSRHIVTKAIAGNTLATSEVAHLLDKAAKWKASGSLHLQALISCSPPSSPIGKLCLSSILLARTLLHSERSA